MSDRKKKNKDRISTRSKERKVDIYTLSLGDTQPQPPEEPVKPNEGKAPKSKESRPQNFKLPVKATPKAKRPPSMTEVVEQTALISASAAAGGAVGAAVGKLSTLLAPLAIGYGVRTNSLWMISGGVGMLMSRSNYSEAQEEEQKQGYFSLSATGKRLSGYMSDWSDKLTLSPKPLKASIISPVPVALPQSQPQQMIIPKAEDPAQKIEKPLDVSKEKMPPITCRINENEEPDFDKM